ncbi:hypothetical protein [uncultured Microbulbifer sp.]|uniref:hypothetical protein n=1 Tax=uncultured Microbulbifer sp. TaxID=348147 RepID=UPI0025FB8D67|nr:hypothetical protein [uncultured Microbulbifer sp.]
MMFWFNLLCFAGILLSLVLIARRRTGVAKRLTAGLIHGAIWTLLWFLAQPPLWLPRETKALLHSEPLARTELLAAISPTQLQALQALEVAGNGFTTDALRDLPPVRLALSPDWDAEAWTLDWNRELTLGDTLALEISLVEGPATTRSLTLEDPFGNAVDSGILSAENPQLVLRDRPRIAGRWEYRVRIEPAESAVATDETTDAEPRSEVLPLVVHPPERPAVLLWSARPGFETAALARWLRQSGTPAQVVTQLAPEMVRTETFNEFQLREAGLLDADTPFDLLILDSRLWPQLSPRQRTRLRTLASKKSLLWLVHNDSGTGFADYARAQGMELRGAAAASISYQSLPGSAPTEIPELKLVSFEPAQRAGGDARTVVGARDLYWARVRPQQSLGFVFFNNSYRWQTAGFANEFSHLWSQIIRQQLAWRGTEAATRMRAPLPRTHQRTTICSGDFSASQPPELFSLAIENANPDKRPLPTARANTDTSGQCYDFWPQQSGWHESDDGFAFYVFDKTSWPEWQTRLARQDSMGMASARLGTAEKIELSGRPIPRYWIALVLLALLTATWWRERIYLR